MPRKNILATYYKQNFSKIKSFKIYRFPSTQKSVHRHNKKKEIINNEMNHILK